MYGWLDDRTYDMRTDFQRRRGGFQNSQRSNEVAFSPDGQTLASASFGGVLLWDVASGKLNTRARRHNSEAVSSFAFTPDGKGLLTSSGHHQAVQLWDVPHACLKHTFERQPGRIRSMAVSSDGQTAVSGAENGIVTIWDLATLRMRWSYDARVGSIHRVALAPAGNVLTVAGDLGMTLWNSKTAEAMPELPDCRGSFLCFAFTPDGHRLIVGHGRLSTPDGLVEWDLATRSHQTLLTEHTGALISLSLSHDGRYLATSAENKNLTTFAENYDVSLYDLKTG